MTSGVRPARLDVDVDKDVTLHVELLGEGRPVVVLHGFTGDASTMLELAQQLAVARHVIIPEMVGHGGSSIPDHVGAYGVEQMAAHVSTLCDRLGQSEFDLVGYSMGGRVALTLACSQPSRVRSLSLIGASAGLASEGERLSRRQADGALADRLESDGLHDFVDDWLRGPLFATQNRRGTEHMAKARDQRLANDPHGLAMSLRGGGTGAMEPLHDRLVDCDVPTLVIAGADDPKFSAIAESLAEAMPNAEVASIAHAGHAAHIEKPEAVANAIDGHMSKVTSK